MPHKIIKCTFECVDQLKLCLMLFCLAAFNSVCFGSMFIQRSPEMLFMVGCRQLKSGCFPVPGCQVAFQWSWTFQGYFCGTVVGSCSSEIIWTFQSHWWLFYRAKDLRNLDCSPKRQDWPWITQGLTTWLISNRGNLTNMWLMHMDSPNENNTSPSQVSTLQHVGTEQVLLFYEWSKWIP